jgi:uncharacterized protein (DUF1015 family)
LADIRPFRAWRYTRAAGDLRDLIAPPYDVVDSALQSRLYARSPLNVIRIDLGLTTPSDNECDNRYTRAALLLENWKRSGVLARDQSPTLTFVEESFTGPDGRPKTRHGFLAAVRLYEFGEGVVFPHELTFAGPKEDRWQLMLATHMGLSPVFLLYELPGDDVISAWKAGAGQSEPAVSVTDGQGTTTRLWPVADQELISVTRQSLSSLPLIIADGHHRYETALRYRDHRRELAGEKKARAPRVSADTASPGTPASDYVLAYLSNMADPGLAVYATHRLVSGLELERVLALPRVLAEDFVVEELAASPDAQTAISAYLEKNPRGAFGLWSVHLPAAYGLRLRDPATLDSHIPGASPAYRRLDVVILQSLVLDKLLGISDRAATERHVTYFKDPAEAFERLASGEFQAGFFLNPTGLDQVRELALGGERMPHKATFFYPKLPTGLVFYDLDGEL